MTRKVQAVDVTDPITSFIVPTSSVFLDSAEGTLTWEDECGVAKNITMSFLQSQIAVAKTMQDGSLEIGPINYFQTDGCGSGKSTTLAQALHGELEPTGQMRVRVDAGQLVRVK